MNPETDKTFIIVYSIRADKEKTVTVHPLGKTEATIFITASTIEEAQGLTDQAKKEALKAMIDYKPIDQEEKPIKKPIERYKTIDKRSIEEAERQINEYKATTAGKRFIKSLELSHKLIVKKAVSGLKYSQLEYFYNILITTGIYETLLKVFDYGFRQGYNTAKKERGKE